jgi:pyruvate,orthophosphate dikinase
MVFGNIGDTSGTGVAFTRDSATGEKVLYGDYLPNAQGEDVVAGIRATMPLEELARRMRRVYSQLKEHADRLEKHYQDLQDIEFTIEQGRLFILQTRSGKRAAQAAIKIAVDMVGEGLIGKEEAVRRVSPEQLEQMMHPQIDPKYAVAPLAAGVAASPGAACGKAVFDADTAQERGQAGEAVILVRMETNPDDVHGLAEAQGVLTARGGKASHAALVARGMGKPAVTGCAAIVVDEARRQFNCNGVVVSEGELVTIDGSTGQVYLGQVPTVQPTMGKEFRQLLRWADKYRRLGVRANADTPQDAATAFGYGAEGIGLCRTEHMFMAEDRLPVMQDMIMAVTERDRRKALDRLLPMQRDDFIGIFKAMRGRPVTIRLLDPPLHEFLPRQEMLIEEVTRLRLTDPTSAELKKMEGLLARVEALKEANPMLGLRGCRLGIIFPEINEMQVRAIFEAACQLKKQGMEVGPEVMIPLVGHANELKAVRQQLEKLAKKVMKEAKVEVDYSFGTMVEIPRAALTADEIAESAEFFSFGTNDLTQTVFGFSRDDAEAKFIFQYLEKGILAHNPFQTLDEAGVGKLMRMAVELGKKTRQNLKLGICGEHGGDPPSIHFCHKIGLNYVSCSPYRVPVARLAAAHAALEEKAGAAAKADV